MFPILPILILLLMGPANAERLADAGRLPSALLAAHRRMAPVCAFIVAPVEAVAPRADFRPPIVRRTKAAVVVTPAHSLVDDGFAPGWPTRAGP